VVAFGTSMPELMTSVIAAWHGTPTLAIANILGSNIANLILALPLGALLAPLKVEVETIRRDLPLMVVATLLFVGLYAWLGLTVVTGLVMLGAMGGVTAFQVVSARQEPAPVQDEWEEEVTGVVERLPSTGGAFLAIVVGIAFMVGGGTLLVEGAVAIAQGMGVSDRLIGLTVVAVGTSAPEIFTTLVAVYRGQTDVAIGNAVGSNLFNLLGIGGVLGVLAPGSGDPGLVAVDAPAVVVVSVVVSILLWQREVMSRGMAVFLLATYSGYVALAAAM